MLIGILSDLHQEFERYNFKKHEDVFYINAGDTHPWDVERIDFQQKCNFNIKGNHDFYGHSFVNQNEGIIDTVNGIKIAGATLWTKLKTELEWWQFEKYMMDARQIHDLSFEEYKRIHNVHKEFLFNSGADIWVTHHCPVVQSVHPKYAGDSANIFFASNYAEEILALPKRPKLIIHGHTHEQFDYMLGDIRVICHPRGYPREQPWFARYEPKVIEVK